MAENDAEKKGAESGAVAKPKAADTAKGAIVDVSAHIAHFGDTLSPLKRYGTVAGRILVVVGLLFVILARGCESVGQRAAARARVRPQVAEADARDDWEADRSGLEGRIRVLREKAEPTEEDNKALQKAQEDLAKLLKDQQKDEADLRRGDWKELQRTARDAASSNQLKGLGREKAFVFGTLLLVFGLLIVGSMAKGPERWLSLVVLAIIILSYYRAVVAVGGM